MEFDERRFADQLNIETPEQVDLRLPVAGMGSRFVAVLIDHAIQFAFYIGVAILIAVWAASVGPRVTQTELNTAGKWFVAFVIVINFLLLWGYFALFEAFWHGQTPGKRVMKLRVIKDSGRQITLFEALARNLLRFVDYLPGLYLAGTITMLCNKKNKRLGDLAAGTLVIHEQGQMQPLMTPGDEARQGNFFAHETAVVESGLPADAVARLEPADLHVIETFFARALDLNLETRAAMAKRIAERMAAKTGVVMPEGNPERMLEAIVRAMRGAGRRF